MNLFSAGPKSWSPGINKTNASATPVFEDITLENIDCTVSDGGGHTAGSSYLIEGLPESQIRALTLRNVRMAPSLKEVACVDAECTCDEATVPCPSCCLKSEPF